MLSYHSRVRRNLRIRPQLIFSLGIVLLVLFYSYSYLKKKQTCWIDSYRSRLFCFVLTNQENLENRARAAYETWGQRCGTFVLITRLNSSRSYTIYDNQHFLINDKQFIIVY